MACVVVDARAVLLLGIDGSWRDWRAAVWFACAFAKGVYVYRTLQLVPFVSGSKMSSVKRELARAAPAAWITMRPAAKDVMLTLRLWA